MQLLITLGYQTTEEAVLRLLDWETKTIIRDLTYRSPVATFLERLRRQGVELPENITPKCKFLGGMFWKGHFYTCTYSEVIRINLNDWFIDHYFTHRRFNDLHNVYADETGIYVCNAGMDTVDRFDHDGQLLHSFPMRPEPLEAWIDPAADYRYIPKTRRDTQVNQVVPWKGELLVNLAHRHEVTRLDRSPVFTGFPNMIHDGILRGGYYYWTTVDGKIVRAHEDTREVETVVDLREECHGPGEPGWCRGLEIVGNLAFAGFTQFRKPSKREFIKFAIRGGKHYPSHVVCYDLARRRLVEMYYFPRPDMVIHGIYEYPYFA